jgi:hypothetical protein
MTKIEPRVRWMWPFPRLRHRLRYGYWCPHEDWTDWQMINTGISQIRYCKRCNYMASR